MTRTARSYQRELQSLRSLLASVTWVQPTYNGSPSCSGCGNQQHMGHEADCPIVKALSRTASTRANPK